jgi:DNA-binding response OmpR family regulator
MICTALWHKMPLMDGLQFARESHAKYDSCVLIVVLTAAENARNRADEIGAQGWIGKSFDIDHLIGMVGAHVSKD